MNPNEGNRDSRLLVGAVGLSAGGDYEPEPIGETMEDEATAPTAPVRGEMALSDYSVAEREQAQDFMAKYPGFGELRSFGGAVDAEQIAFSWRLMPPGTGGRGSYGHKHKTQEEVIFVVSGTVTFKIGDEVFEAGPKTAVRIAPHAVRSIHNDSEEDAEVILCSVRVEDVREDVELEEDFWPD